MPSTFLGFSVTFALVAGLMGRADAQIVILTTTGETRDGLSVVRRHPDPSPTESVLSRGYSGRLLRLYAREQEYLRRKTGRSPGPAYLVLSDRQGGFRRFGFYLGDEKKPDAGWVDLHRSSTLSGRFGAMDQIFPHELLHVIVRQLAGAPRHSDGNPRWTVALDRAVRNRLRRRASRSRRMDGLVDLTSKSWNPLLGWIRRIDALRCPA